MEPNWIEKCMFTPGRGTEPRERFSEGWHQLQHILSGEVFAWYIREERDAKLMHVRLVPSCSSLFLKPAGCIMNKVSDRNEELIWDLGGVQMVATGRKVKEESKIKNALELFVDGDQCLSLYYGNWPWKEIQMVAKDPSIAQTWQHWLQAFMMHEKESLGYVCHLDAWLLSRYSQLKTCRESVHAVYAITSFTGYRLWKASTILGSLLKSNEDLNLLVHEYLGDLPFPIYQLLYYSYAVTERSDIRHLYYSNTVVTAEANSYRMPAAEVTKPSHLRRRSSIKILNFRSRSDQRRIFNTSQLSRSDCSFPMSTKAFLKFLHKTQRNKNITLEEAKDVILKYDFQFLHNPNTNGVTDITLEGFAHYLLTLESASDTSHSPLEDTSHPLSSYFIASSHNTYLTGHQLHGESSTAMYATVLQTGCRCVELDCWDAEDGDPVIYHGHTLTTKVKFEHVVQTIAENAFVSTSYPLILSIENHCSIPQQVKMATYMKQAFGDSLLTDFLNGDASPNKLPSPEELRHKVLIKNRKLLNTTSNAPQSPGTLPESPAHLQHAVNSNESPLSSPLMFTKSFFSNEISPTPFCYSPLTPNSAPSCSGLETFGFPTSSGPPEPNKMSPKLFRKDAIKDDDILTNDTLLTCKKNDKQWCSAPSSPSIPMATIFEDELLIGDKVTVANLEKHTKQTAVNSQSCNSHPSPVMNTIATDLEGSILLSPSSSVSDLSHDLSLESGFHGNLSFPDLVEEDSSMKYPAPRNRRGAVTKELFRNVPSSSTTSMDLMSEENGVLKENVTIESKRDTDKKENEEMKLCEREVEGKRDQKMEEERVLDSITKKGLGVVTRGSDKYPIINKFSSPLVKSTDSSHHILDMLNNISHKQASRTSSSESSHSESDSHKITRPKSIMIHSDDQLHESVLNANAQIQHDLKSTSKEEKAHDPSNDQEVISNESAIDESIPFSPSASSLSSSSSSFSSPFKFRRIRSRDINDDDEDSILPITCYPQNSCFFHERTSSLPKDFLVTQKEDSSAISSSNVTARNSSCQEINDPTNTEDEDGSCESVSLLSILTQLSEQAETLQSSKQLESVATTAQKKKEHRNTIYSDLLPSSPSIVALRRRTFHKSISFSPVTQKKPLYDRRRGSMGALQFMGNDTPSIFLDTVEASYSKCDVAKELSDLVVYTEAKKFPGFKDPKRPELKCTEMYSVNESAAKKATKKTPAEVFKFTRNHLLRIYPAATRFNSSNFNPAQFWMYGCQMVALNYQTNDSWMQYYSAFFRQNGGCGYVLKPPELRPSESNSNENRLNAEVTQLKLNIVSAQHHSVTTNSQAILDIEVFGVPRDCTKFKLHSATINGTCILWEKNNCYPVDVTFTPIAALKFMLTCDKDSTPLTQVIMIKELQYGYQHIYFTEDSLITDHAPSSLFINLQKDNSDEPQDDFVFTPIEHGLSNDDVNDNTDGSELVIVPIHYSDLPGVDLEPITRFADSTTTAMELLAGALAHLGTDITTICPQINGKDEDKTLQYFQFTLAKESEDGHFEKLTVLKHNALLYKYFQCKEKHLCLLVSMKDNNLPTNSTSVVETVSCSAQTVAVSQRASLHASGFSSVVYPSSIWAKNHGEQSHYITSVNELSLAQNSSTYQQRRVSVDMHFQVQNSSKKTHITSGCITNHPLATVSYRKEDHMNQKRSFLGYEESFSVSQKPKKFLSGKRKHIIKERKLSTSSIFEITNVSPSIKIKQSVTFAEDPSSDGKKRNIGQKIRRKIFGDHHSKTEPTHKSSMKMKSSMSSSSMDEDKFMYSNEQSDDDSDDPEFTSNVSEPFYYNAKSSLSKRTTSFKHPCKKYSTGLNMTGAKSLANERSKLYKP